MNRNWFTGLLTAAVLAAAPIVQLNAAPADDAATVTHVVSRLTFAPTPGDVDRVRAMGLSAWIDRQLHPERIDDHTTEAMLPVLDAPPDGVDPKELRRFARRQIETLASAKLLRAMYSERQLQEVLVDFWFNHFNVYAAKGRTAEYLPGYEADAIRPHLLGHFRDLLGATAKSPAMLFYLDNWLSADPDGPHMDVRAPRMVRGGFGGRVPL